MKDVGGGTREGDQIVVIADQGERRGGDSLGETLRNFETYQTQVRNY